MTAAHTKPAERTAPALDAEIAAACDTVAPTWPLDRFIAVNPYWGRIGSAFGAVDTDLKRIMGSTLYMPRSYYSDAFEAGRITLDDLQEALTEIGDSRSPQALLTGLSEPVVVPARLPLLSDIIDSRRDLAHRPAWTNALLHQVTQFCAAYFDHDQAEWRPGDTGSLYASWHRAIQHDQSTVVLMRAPQNLKRARSLPATPEEVFQRAAEQFELGAAEFGDYLQAVLGRINGWAAWSAYLRWQARLEGGDDQHIVELLALRVAWELLLDSGDRDADSVFAQWQQQWRAVYSAESPATQPLEAIWQRAEEIAYQRPVARALAEAGSQARTEIPPAQVAFCIDVRSEVFRRALERTMPQAQTMGFAGFFGLPIQYTPLGTAATRPQLPGLLAPALDVTDTSGVADEDQRLTQTRRTRLLAQADWRPFENLPASAFTLIESLGLSYLGKLVKRTLPSQRAAEGADHVGLEAQEVKRLEPQLAPANGQTLAERAALAQGVLGAMSLTTGFARLVVLVGHGSQSANNPHAAGLDCGACCGQTGEVNSRALAALLNDADVRRELAAAGVGVPDTTLFIAGLHNTTTDEVTLYDTVPASHRDDVAALQAALDDAGVLARAERAADLGLGDVAGRADALRTAVKTRANNWAQTRPEWGLANCAAFVVAPRSRSAGVDLGGRSFLHDYNWKQDTAGSVLELIMTAPMIVTHWINMQYYASTVDNRHFGSGNKILHNVVGGRIGVFEGNGGDLRIGLPLQSIHNGKQWMHNPLRLSVFIEAPREMIETVIANHDMVKTLLDNQWLYLYRLEDKTTERYSHGDWLAA